MPVTKLKPARSSRMLGIHADQVQEDTKKSVERSESVLARSRKLVKKSKEIVAATRKRRAG